MSNIVTSASNVREMRKRKRDIHERRKPLPTRASPRPRREAKSLEAHLNFETSRTPFKDFPNKLVAEIQQLCLILHQVSVNSPTLKHSRREVRMGGGSEGLGPTRRLASKLLLLCLFSLFHGDGASAVVPLRKWGSNTQAGLFPSTASPSVAAGGLTPAATFSQYRLSGEKENQNAGAAADIDVLGNQEGMEEDAPSFSDMGSSYSGLQPYKIGLQPFYGIHGPEKGLFSGERRWKTAAAASADGLRHGNKGISALQLAAQLQQDSDAQEGSNAAKETDKTSDAEDKETEDSTNRSDEGGDGDNSSNSSRSSDNANTSASESSEAASSASKSSAQGTEETPEATSQAAAAPSASTDKGEKGEKTEGGEEEAEEEEKQTTTKEPAETETAAEGNSASTASESRQQQTTETAKEAPGTAAGEAEGASSGGEATAPNEETSKKEAREGEEGSEAEKEKSEEEQEGTEEEKEGKAAEGEKQEQTEKETKSEAETKGAETEEEAGGEEETKEGKAAEGEKQERTEKEAKSEEEPKEAEAEEEAEETPTTEKEEAAAPSEADNKPGTAPQNQPHTPAATEAAGGAAPPQEAATPPPEAAAPPPPAQVATPVPTTAEQQGVSAEAAAPPAEVSTASEVAAKHGEPKKEEVAQKAAAAAAIVTLPPEESTPEKVEGWGTSKQKEQGIEKPEEGKCYSDIAKEIIDEETALIKKATENVHFQEAEQGFCDEVFRRIDGPFSLTELSALLRAADVANSTHRNFRVVIAGCGLLMIRDSCCLVVFIVIVVARCLQSSNSSNLLTQHAESAHRKNHGCFALELLCDAFKPEFVKRFKDKDKALGIAAGRRHVFLQNSSPPRVNDGDSILHAAIAARKPHVVEVLLQYGAFPELPALPHKTRPQTQTGAPLQKLQTTEMASGTPMHAAALVQAPDSVEAMELLMHYGAKADSRDSWGRTPLMVAALHPTAHSHEFIKRLILAKADVKATDKAGLSALHYAAAADNWGVVGILLDHGADAAAVDSRGNTALHYAASFNSYTATTRLLEKAELALSNINQLNYRGKAPIHLAAAPDSFQAVPRPIVPALALEALLMHHANPMARDRSGNTPLHLASRGGYVEIVRRLVALTGAPPDEKNADGLTPLAMVEKAGKGPGREEIAQFLREYSQKRSCVEPPLVRHSTRIFSDTMLGPYMRVGDTVTYTCNPGFTMMGHATVTCHERDGKMEFVPSAPLCIRTVEASSASAPHLGLLLSLCVGLGLAAAVLSPL
ncbi:hypothetical protein, conserved [Eimeria maxima]|uniref:Sushi domain-containing protein n=1 Tax=Eimeria maxima TaxID=5804 RepID=U6M0J2_EIMMA|nr:hypothetical protein, conserved [Eimeria maxima]CDJ56593.1 hypothetical protein, conserved [Eimeria maxima]